MIRRFSSRLQKLDTSLNRFIRLYQFIKSGKLEIRVFPDEAFGLIHGKAGVIQYNDGSQTCFMGSTNESLSAWKLNYELVWEDDSIEAIKWAQDEFDALWFHPLAISLSDFVIRDIKRLAHRSEISVDSWKDNWEKPFSAH